MGDILMDFPEKTQKLLKDVLSCRDGELSIRQRGDEIVLENRFELCFEYDVVLKHARGLPSCSKDTSFMAVDLRREGGVYVLTGELDDRTQDEIPQVTLYFDAVEAVAWPVRADLRIWPTRPWMQLSSLGYGIVRKSELVPWLVNESERALLPLLREVSLLNHWSGLDPTVGDARFPLLRERLPRELLADLDRVERNQGDAMRFWKCTERLQRRLNRSCYEQVWMSLWDEIDRCQQAYELPASTSARAPEITALLHGMGYEGTYPDYQKITIIAKGKWMESYGRFHFVPKGTRAACYIRCCESTFGGEMYLNFLSGTELLDEDAEPGGIGRCGFNASGRRFLHSTSCGDDLESKLCLAAKKAELGRLTRQEKKMDGQASAWTLFFWVFVLAGGAFATLLTLGFLFTGILTTGITGEIPTRLNWLQVFAMSWILFGGAMGLWITWDHMK